MIIDISQEVFSCHTWPTDPVPVMDRFGSIDKGDMVNVTAFSMCAHNGTHVDAPFHFLNDGTTIDQLPLECFVGDCYVARHEGDVTADDAKNIMEAAQKFNAAQRILIAGKATVTEDAAHVFADAGVLLVGNESQTVGPEDAPRQVHLILLGAGVVLLEGLKMDGVAAGKYFLSAAPLNLGGCEGSPCRALLIR